MDILTWILTAISTVTGGTAFYTFVMYRQQAKRFKTAEAFEKEVTALQSAMSGLQDQIRFQEQRLNEMQKTLINKDAYINTLSADKNLLEIKHAKNKGAINTAYGCNFCQKPSECPVLMQRARNEEEYLKHIENVSNFRKQDSDGRDDG